MKIVFVGGGTGGHFYPLIAVAQEVDRYAQENQLLQPKKYYFGPVPYDEKALYGVDMRYVYCSAGKMRRTKDLGSRIKNMVSFLPILFGMLKALINLFIIFPDVVFSKGGYASFPTLWAARLIRIPVVIHESDAVLGRVTRWSASFAQYIAIAYPEAEKGLSEKEQSKTAIIGVPMRREVLHNPLAEAYKLLRLDPEVPTVAVLGGSSGAQYVNDNLLDVLPKLLEKYQVVHQTGTQHIAAVTEETKSYLRMFQNTHTYLPVASLNAYHMRALYSVADILLTRAGSGTLHEIAEWGIPSIIIPIRDEVSHDQRTNAYAYARAAGGTVIEEQNLAPHLLISEVDRVLSNKELHRELSEKAKTFAKPDAAKKAARILVDILKSHEV